VRWTGRWRLSALLVVGAVLAACASSTSVDRDRLRGSMLTVLGSWSGVEQARFTAVLTAFTTSTGARIRYISANGRYMPDLIDAAIARGRPPDVALLPQPGLLRRYAMAGRLVPLDAATRELVHSHYAPIWRSLASSGGKEYGVWFKAANKSLVWYDVASFERAGVVPPGDLAGLERVAVELRRHGVTPFAVGGYDGWTLTDLFENLYLRLAGPARYDELTVHRIPWTDTTVSQTLAVMRRLFAPRNLMGGTKGALRTSFERSVPEAFGPPARAAMLIEGDFVAGFIASGGRTRIGADVDVVPFPGSYGGLPVVVGGGDVAVQLTPGPAATELMRYLASPEAAAVWAAKGGYVSPNLDVDLSVYPDALSRSVARQVIEAGSGFRFDLSDMLPADFGSAPWSGMQGALRSFLRERDVAAAQRSLEAAAERTAGR
jgi:alpha-glucoside transport system substrate-binding protein